MAGIARLQTPAKPAGTDSLGCPSADLEGNGKIAGKNVIFHRKVSKSQRLGRVSMPPADRGLLVGVSLEEGHRRRVFHEHHATDHEMGDNSIYIRSFDEDYKADLSGSFNFILIELQPEAFCQIARDTSTAGIPSLRYTAAETDPITANLARAIEPAFGRSAEVSELFLDQLSITIGMHLLQHYNQAAPLALARARVLSRGHERLAKDLIREQLDGNISIADVAAACELSRGYFSYAFRETTGRTPYQWLIKQRVERACDLLRDSTLSLSEIALDCGFADQSHFTRVFSKCIGLSPGKWRRQALL